MRKCRLLFCFLTIFTMLLIFGKSTSFASYADESEELKNILQKKTVIGLVYLQDEYPVRLEADYESSIELVVPSGHQVQILDVIVDDSFEIWNYVTLFHNEIQYYGYIPRNRIACSDEEFLAWEKSNGLDIYNISLLNELDEDSISDDILQFPDSYQEALIGLKKEHPNWVFVKMNTNLDWETVLSNELYGSRSLIPSSFPSYMQNGLYSSGWSFASKETLAYYMDPRNGLNESVIFQYELLTYNSSYQKENIVQNFLKNTFMSGYINGMDKTYAKTFFEVGEQLNVSPVHLACRVYQEQGKGNSALISGNYPGYEGYYNYFNIGASGNTDKAVIESGLAKAISQGWSNPYLSILGGATVISANYILKGQDTLYLQKFDVEGSYNGLYWHQYMQNICAPTSEAKNVRKSYIDAGSLDNVFVFKIPVYMNMPEDTSPLPAVSYSITLNRPDGYTDHSVTIDGIPYNIEDRDNQITVTLIDETAKTAVMYQYNEAGIPVGMTVWTLSHNGLNYTVTEVPQLKDLLTYHGFSVRITGKSGIRFKSGISATLRNTLTTTGVDGYLLKEYGTLVMNHANSSQYAFIKDGEKVLCGLAYGKSSNGVMVDTIYEKVNDRYHFTSVLVGLPDTQYKTDYIFRAYMVLSKNGSDVIIYGPSVYRSIYSLASVVLETGKYPEDSSAYLFLQKIITDADNIQ